MSSLNRQGLNASLTASAGRRGDYSEELWRACAGRLVCVPERGDRVWYFPQGHMEQVAASTQSHCQHLPNSGLPPQILCRVVHRVLSAERETDEVYAQISLLPESTDATVAPQVSDYSDGAAEVEAAIDAKARSSSVRMFVKILTPSDTSTHGGFSVPRKHAQECLPPLDTTQETPSQDLCATDLHGNEWRFRHTFRGHPRRHLLTTGWSLFVSYKRLVAGDAVIFLRGEIDGNPELRVGIRRAKRQLQAAAPPYHHRHQPLVMSSHSMHMGVVATASHALATRTIFSLFYKPRLSPSPFLVPVEKLAITACISLSVGMRFKMRFETDDGSDRSYAGTIMAMAELDSEKWPGSKWRSIKVNWEESAGGSSGELPDRVSPWEIDATCASTPTLSSSQSAAPPQPTRARSGKRRSAASSAGRPASSASSMADLYSSAKLPWVLQGQDVVSEMSPTVLSMRSSRDHHRHLHHQQHIEHHHYQQLACLLPPPQLMMQQGEMPNSRPTSQNTRSTSFFGDFVAPPSLPPPMGMATQLCYQSVAGSHSHGHGDSHSEQQARHNLLGSTAWTLTPLSSPSPPPSTMPSGSGMKEQSECKLFGISLRDCPGAVASSSDTKDTRVQQSAEEEQNKSEEGSSRAKGTVVESRNRCSRSLTKVMKKGSMVGRGIDLSRFDSYGGLLRELEAMFHMRQGELSDTSGGWQVAYSDSDGDTMKVGDDPWPEFCSMVKKLHILSPEEANTWARKP